jgi:hypothetical protein
MEIITIILSALAFVLAILYVFVTFLLPFYVRRIMKAVEEQLNRSRRLEQIQETQLTAFNEQIKLLWEISNK